MKASFGSRKPLSPVSVGIWALYIFLKTCFGSCTLINHKFLFKNFPNIFSILKSPVIKVELSQCWNIKYLDIVTSFLFKWMPRFFCTMINKWNLSRETTQMACRISFQTESPAVTKTESLSLLILIEIHKNLLPWIFLNIDEWTGYLSLYYDFPAKQFYELASDLESIWF